MRVLRFIDAHATAIMFLGVVCGVILQPLAAIVGPVLLPLIVLTLLLATMRTDLGALGAVLRRPASSLTHVAWLLLLSPAAVFAGLSVLPVPTELVGPLVLFAAAPPIASMPSFAILFGLDASFVLIGMSLASILCPLTVPAVAGLVMHGQIAISPTDLAIRLALLIVGSLLAGLILRRALGPERIARQKRTLDALFVAAATLIGIALMDGIVALTLADPRAMAIIVAGVFGFSFLLFAAAAFVFLPAGLPAALGVALNSGGRSIAMVLAVVGGGASPELIMVVAAAQLPIFVFPLFQRPLIRWLMQRSAHPAQWSGRGAA